MSFLYLYSLTFSWVFLQVRSSILAGLSWRI